MASLAHICYSVRLLTVRLVFKPTRERFSFYSAHTFTHLSTGSLFRKLWLSEYHRQAKEKLLKNQGWTQYILPFNIRQSQGKQITC